MRCKFYPNHCSQGYARKCMSKSGHTRNPGRLLLSTTFCTALEEAEVTSVFYRVRSSYLKDMLIEDKELYGMQPHLSRLA
jgi:hypothetical protein